MKKLSGNGVTVARFVTNEQEWFDSTFPLQLIFDLPSKIAMAFRKQYLKGFLRPGSCNYYIGATINGRLFGVLGFLNPTYGKYDLLLKADTTIPQYKNSVDLLLYLLRSKSVKEHLEKKFCREIKMVYSMCFSPYEVISRYRKHAKLITKRAIRHNKKSDMEEDVKNKANAKVRTELKAGRIIKQPCEVCGIAGYVETHHKDYTKPLEINWLCIKHHNERDAQDETAYKISGYELGYIFQMGSIVSIKQAKALFMDKHK